MIDHSPKDDGRKPRPAEVLCGSPLDETCQKYAENALHILWELAGRDCFCEDYPESSSKCETCIARDAMAEVRKIAYPVIRSLHEGRLSYAEGVFFEKWVDENTKKRGLNGGNGVLELILSDNANDHVARVSQRDMDVATTVVQWFGTNCGRGFLDECEREIKRRDAQRSDLFNWAHNKRSFAANQEQTEVQQMATDIANRYGSSSFGRATLRSEILGLLEKQKQKLADSLAQLV